MPRFVIQLVTWGIAIVTVSKDDNEGVSAIHRNLATARRRTGVAQMVPPLLPPLELLR
jgi:hypothetical protein